MLNQRLISASRIRSKQLILRAIQTGFEISVRQSQVVVAKKRELPFEFIRLGSQWDPQWCFLPSSEALLTHTYIPESRPGHKIDPGHGCYYLIAYFDTRFLGWDRPRSSCCQRLSLGACPSKCPAHHHHHHHLSFAHRLWTSTCRTMRLRQRGYRVGIGC
jgi:hypothetical protein